MEEQEALTLAGGYKRGFMEKCLEFRESMGDPRR